jgi:hypothetical protein
MAKSALRFAEPVERSGQLTRQDAVIADYVEAVGRQ